LRHLKWAGNPPLAQIVVLRLRLLATSRHRRLETIRELLATDLAAEKREQYQNLLAAESRALKLVKGYESRALGLAAAGPRKSTW
jgi:hypothetical protein